MAFWGKKSIKDSLIKYLNEQGVTYKEELGCLSFDLYFKKSEYTVYPYLKINENNEELSIIINLREVLDSFKDYSRINNFNCQSKYMIAKVRDGLLYLEYNCHVTYDNLAIVLENAVESLFALQEEIDKL